MDANVAVHSSGPSTATSFHTAMTSPPLDNHSTNLEMRLGLARLGARWNAARETSQWTDRQAIVGPYSVLGLRARDKIFITHAVLDAVTTIVQEHTSR